MRKKILTVATICALAMSTTLSSCIGSFALTNKLLAWNQSIDSKFVNELVFFAFLIVPVYEVSALADILVLNSIEFWSGDSPLASAKTIDGADGRYLVQSDECGYTITRESDGAVTRLNYHADAQEWTVVGQSGEEYTLMQFVDDTRVKVPGANGDMMEVELSDAGLYAYHNALMLGSACAQR